MTNHWIDLQHSDCILSPMVGDANSMTPEYKAFMVNIDKIKA